MWELNPTSNGDVIRAIPFFLLLLLDSVHKADIFLELLNDKLAMVLASRYLSYTDLTGEVAFAVLMVIIINGYVALSDLNTGFLYIVGVNLAACVGWGLIDGLIYAVSNSIARNRMRNKLLSLKSSADLEVSIGNAKKSLDDTFLADFDEQGKEAIAKEIVTHVPQASLSNGQLMTKKEVMGWLSIVGLYLLTGFLLALPFLVLQHKLLAWLASNLCGAAWLFWYGVQLGKFAGRNRWLLGFVMGLTGIMFLVISYVVWT